MNLSLIVGNGLDRVVVGALLKHHKGRRVSSLPIIVGDMDLALVWTNFAKSQNQIINLRLQHWLSYLWFSIALSSREFWPLISYAGLWAVIRWWSSSDGTSGMNYDRWQRARPKQSPKAFLSCSRDRKLYEFEPDGLGPEPRPQCVDLQLVRWLRDAKDWSTASHHFLGLIWQRYTYIYM